MTSPLLALASDIDTWSLAAVRSGADGSFALKLGVMRGSESATLTLAASHDEARALAFGILATVGDATLRTFEPGLLKSAAPRAAATVASAPVPPPEEGRAQGFTGDICDHCLVAAMLRTGHCLTCQNCGANTGCS